MGRWAIRISIVAFSLPPTSAQGLQACVISLQTILKDFLVTTFAMQITIEQTLGPTSASSANQLRSVVQRQLRPFEDDIQFVRISLFKASGSALKPSYEVTCRIGSRDGSTSGTFHGVGSSAVFALEASLRDAVDKLKSS